MRNVTQDMTSHNHHGIDTSQNFTTATYDTLTGNTTELAVYNRLDDLAKYEVAVSGLILYFAVFGNIFVLLVLKCRRGKLSRMQWFIVHLSMADLFVAFFNVLPQMIWDITYVFYGNNFLCKLVKYLQVVAMYASSYVLVMTALDRYISICYPLTSQTWTTRRVNVMVAIAWGLSLGLSVPQLFIFSYVEVMPGVYNCYDNFGAGNNWRIKTYVTWIFVSIYAFPVVALTLTYSRICYVVWVSVGSKENTNVCPKRNISKSKWKNTFRRDNEQGNGGNRSPAFVRNPRAHTRGMSKSKIKTVKLTLTVILCYVFCWAPFFIGQMWSVYDEKAPFSSPAMAIVMLLASLNSCTNPWIYLAFSGKVCIKRMRTVSRTWTVTTNTYVDPETRQRNSANVEMSTHNSKIEKDAQKTDLLSENI
ncbi:hypothetical protein ScPMuIL_016925 [Solemya velum]